jgi:hypothetical protein
MRTSGAVPDPDEGQQSPPEPPPRFEPDESLIEKSKRVLGDPAEIGDR